MQAEVLKDFRLVGGTALSLQFGHRISDDIDLFTDLSYGSVDFTAIEIYLENSFTYVYGEFGGNPGFGKSYIIGNSRDAAIKLDLYYTTDPFLQEPKLEDGVRMATIEEIIAMKVEIVQRGGRKKDFGICTKPLNCTTLNK